MLDLETDEFILLASDGLWDVVTSAEAVACVRASFPNYKEGLRKLMQMTKAKGGLDDTTFELIELKHYTEQKLEACPELRGAPSGETVILDINRFNTDSAGSTPAAETVIDDIEDMFAE